VQVGGAGLEVAGVRLQEGVVVPVDSVTEDVDRLLLAGEPRGQLLGDEDVVAIGDLEAAIDRVVIGDGHEVHTPALGQLIDLLRRCRAFGEPHAPLNSELCHLRRGRVAMHVRPGTLTAYGNHRCSLFASYFRLSGSPALAPET
jgi:hypothetical protein